MKRSTRSMRAAATLLVTALALLAGCSTTSKTQFLHENADLGAITKVAVLPFENVTGERSAAEKVQKIFYLELLSLDVFEVAEPGSVGRSVRAADIPTLTPADFQRIGKELGVDAVFTGSIVDFEESKSAGGAPELTLQLRLVETSSGTTIWSTGQSRSGAGLSTRLFGVGNESTTQAARGMIRSQLRTLLK
jgi:TolB-like protein